MSELNPISGKTLDLTEENIDKLKELFPEVLTDGQIDFEKLRLILGDEINDKLERYSFTWNGKNDAIKLAQQPSTGTLKPNKENSKNWDTTENLYIEGDNLEVLKLLQKPYAGKVKVIYIDPPYNTGNDFVYKDNYKDNIENYFEQTGQIDIEGKRLSTNTESNGRFHTEWLNLMYPRLLLAKNLLADDGVIFISIDDNEQVNLRRICDEIFGEQNFTAQFIWTKTSTPPSLSNKTRDTVEYVVCYEKSKNSDKFFGSYLDNKDTPILKNTNTIKTLKFPKDSIYFNFIEEGTIHAKDYNKAKVNNDITIKNHRNINDVEITARFTWTQSKLDEEYEKGCYFLTKTENFSMRVQKKDSDAYKTPNNHLNKELNKKVDVLTNEEAVKELDSLGLANTFSYPKPKSLIKYLINMKTNNSKDGIVLDFFAGSSTTAHATMELNAEDGGKRNFIMVQLPEPLSEKDFAYKDGFRNLSEISQERIRRTGDKIVENLPIIEGELDTGFKAFELDTSNIQKWNVDSENIEESLFSMENNFVEGRSHSDIVYEVLLKLGLDLNTPFEECTVDGSTVYDVAFGNVYIVLGSVINQEVTKHIANKQKEYENENPSVVFNDNGFLNDNEKLNSIEILKNNGFNEEQLMSI